MRFLLACEGQSDAGLVPHIQRLIIESGETDVDGDPWFYGGPLAQLTSWARFRDDTLDAVAMIGRGP